ncbi:MAG: hypothetical protein WA160_02265 [Pseudobdellovibrio sp.]
MSFLEINIRGGGIVVNNEDWGLQINSYNSNISEIGSHGLQLIRPSAIKGMFSYLLGYTTKSSDISTDEDLNYLVKNYEINVARKPFVSTFFARKDFFQKKTNYIQDKNVNLNPLKFLDADSSIQLLEPVLRGIFKTTSIGQINNFFKNSLFLKMNDLDSEMLLAIKPDTSGIPEGSKMGRAMISYFDSQISKNENGKFSEAIILLIEETSKLAKSDKKFRNDLINSPVGKFSCFTSPEQTRHWANKNSVSYVRGEPLNLINIDYDIIVKNPNVKLIERLANGPFVVKWAEGGFGILRINKYDQYQSELRNEANNDSTISISDLRRGGLKLKYQSWENRNE